MITKDILKTILEFHEEREHEITNLRRQLRYAQEEAHSHEQEVIKELATKGDYGFLKIDWASMKNVVYDRKRR